MSKERYVEHTVALELPIRDSVTKGNYNLADIETKYLPIQTEVVSDNKDKTINKLQQQIAELKQQLERHNKYFNSFSCDNFDEFADFISTFMLTPHEEQTLIKDLKKQLEEKEEDKQYLKKMYLSEKTKNDYYHTEKYGLHKPVEELTKIKLTPKEKEIYYKGFDNCERQFATHIAELQQELKSQPAEIVEKIGGEIYTRMVVECKETKYTDINLILNTILKEYQK